MTNSDWPWPHFTRAELSCKHCGELPEDIDTDLLDKLELLRAHMGQPLRINSGHRCRIHNLAVGGATYSQHKKLAVDVALDLHDPKKLYTIAIALGFLGIGLGNSFIHLDMRREIDGHQPSRKLTVFYYPGTKAKWDKILKEGTETDGLA